MRKHGLNRRLERIEAGVQIGEPRCRQCGKLKGLVAALEEVESLEDVWPVFCVCNPDAAFLRMLHERIEAAS